MADDVTLLPCEPGFDAELVLDALPELGGIDATFILAGTLGASDRARFDALTEAWPEDIRAHARALAAASRR